MIISRTPARISFFGGGTDYPDYFKDTPGASLVTTINKYTYLNVRWLPKFFEFKYRIVYSKVEDVNEIKFIQHPSVRETLKFLGVSEGIEVHPCADLPHRAGLASSSAFTVGFLNAMYALLGVKKDKWELATQAIHIEQKMCEDIVGCQDQISVAMGGFNHIKFEWENGPKYTIEKVRVGQERLIELQNNLLLYFTGFSRNATEIAKHQVENIKNKKNELKLMHSFVQQGIDIIHSGDLDDFGRLLHESWKVKRDLTRYISNDRINAMYEIGLSSGALGGKILGAGGGGFLLLYCPTEQQSHLKKSMSSYLHVPFKFENTGTQIIVDSEDDHGR